MTLFTVIANPYRANAIEWVHAGLLTVGALVVGLEHRPRGPRPAGADPDPGRVLVARRSRRSSRASPSTPTATSAASSRAGPTTCTRTPPAASSASPRPWRTPGRRGCDGRRLRAGLLLDLPHRHRDHPVPAGDGRARGRADRDRDADPQLRRERRSKVILLAVAAGMGFILVMVRNQVASGNEFNSFFQRVDWFGESIRIWQTDPLFGVGLRWWYTDRFDTSFQPPNAILEMLSTAGLFGLAGFLVLMVGSPGGPVADGPTVRAGLLGRDPEPPRPGPARPVLGRRPDVGPVPHRRHLPRRAGPRAGRRATGCRASTAERPLEKVTA